MMNDPERLPRLDEETQVRLQVALALQMTYKQVCKEVNEHELGLWHRYFARHAGDSNWQTSKQLKEIARLLKEWHAKEGE